MNSSRMAFWLCIVALVLAIGCAGLTARTQGRADMVVVDNLVAPDLPTPSGFRIDNDRSYFKVDATTGTRIVFVTYRGRGEALALMDFFRQNMAISGWHLKRESGDFGAYVLNFEKDKEAAEVRIVPTRASTEFSISVSPRASSR